MSKSQAIKIVNRYAKKLDEYEFPVAFIYLFGSWAKGTAGKNSDIDVAVISKGPVKIEDSFILRRIRRMVDTRIEPHSLSLKDFVEDANPIVAEIKNTGTKLK